MQIKVRLLACSKQAMNGMTELTITEKGWTPSQMSVFAYAGMYQSLDKLARVLQEFIHK